MKRLMIIVFSLLIASNLWAQDLNADKIEDAGKRLSFIGAFGLGFGGDELPTNTDQEKSDDNDIKAGDAIILKMGVIVQPLASNSAWEIQTTLGWKGEGEFGRDANKEKGRFSRYPLDVIAFYKFDKLRCGAGLTYHFSPKLEGDHLPADVDGDFDNALGLILGVDYLFGNHFMIGANYEIIEYESDTETINGNNFALLIGLRF